MRSLFFQFHHEVFSKRLLLPLVLIDGLLLAPALSPQLVRAQDAPAVQEGAGKSAYRLTPKRKSLLDKAADYSTQFSGRVVLVLHRGELVYERYDRDWLESRPHMLASGTKSFSGVIAMFAVHDGLLSLDELACETLTEWKEDPRKSKITIRHLLTLSSGLHPADAAFPNRRQAGSNPNPILQQRQERIARQDANDGLKDLATGNWFRDALKVPAKREPGSEFEYGPSHFYA
ncbi:MAG: serine hydrolase, partial [Planctomycetes bacterium]|nr:serine hydrolase [Planctomycetota bacterium]